MIEMKKHIMILIVALSFGMNLYAQNDGFFKSSYTEYREDDIWNELPGLPNQYGVYGDYDAIEPAPIGSGLLLLTGLGLYYLNRRRKDN